MRQIEVNPFLYRKATIDFFAAQKGISIVAYKPLVRGKGTEHPAVRSMAEKYGTTPGDVLLRWGAQKGLILLPKSTNPARMEANLAAFDGPGTGGTGGAGVTISEEDVAALDALTDPVESDKTFQAHFASRAVVDEAGPTLALGYA